MKFTNASLIGISTAIATFAPVAAQAQSTEGGEAIVVTGVSLEETLPRELARYGSDIETVSDQQVRDRGDVDVASALKNVSGLYIVPASGPFSYVDVALQGSRTQDVLWVWPAP